MGRGGGEGGGVGEKGECEGGRGGGGGKSERGDIKLEFHSRLFLNLQQKYSDEEDDVDKSSRQSNYTVSVHS